MARAPRHHGVISRQSDESYSEDHWLKEFENKLEKTSVQPRGQSIYDQISSIMNTKSKYPSVQAAVDDMMHRSGLSDYLQNVKTSEEEASDQPRKTAQDNQQAKSKKEDAAKDIPKILKLIPALKRTLENIIKETRGNMPIPAIVARLKSLHASDCADEAAWDDDNLLRLVSKCNLEAKKNNPGSYDSFDNLGQGDHSTRESDIDASNTDAFNALMPAKI